MKNTDILKSITAYETKNADKFIRHMEILKDQNYKITKHILDDNGNYKLLAELEPAEIVDCMLRNKNIPEHDLVRNPNPRRRNICVFDYGHCTCADKSKCLYQKTPENEDIIKTMVKKYENSDVEYYNKCSSYYEDTEYGRIFTWSYEHLNKMGKLNYERLVDLNYYDRRM